MEKNYKFSIREAFNGWAKLLKNKLVKDNLSQYEKDIIIERMDSCNSCPDRKWNICGACGCFLPAKVILMNQKCKKNRWRI